MTEWFAGEMIRRCLTDSLHRTQSWETRLIATGVADFDDAVTLPGKAGKREPKSEVQQEDKKPKIEGADGTAYTSSNKASRVDGSSDATGNRRDDRDEGDEDENGASGSAKAGDKRKKAAPESNSDEIGSDLDDSDDDVDGDGNENGGDADTILCLYDKVQRIKNKWKCVLRDGVANVDGKEYLFSRCNTEFEW